MHLLLVVFKREEKQKGPSEWTSHLFWLFREDSNVSGNFPPDLTLQTSNYPDAAKQRQRWAIIAILT